MDHLYYLFYAFHAFASVHSALWLPAEKELTSWLLFVMFNCVFVNFPCGILGQVRYLIVSIPDLYSLSSALVKHDPSNSSFQSVCFP